MKKIVVNFKSIRDIQNLKSVMKAVHSGKRDHIPDIEKLNLGKRFAPSLVDHAEIKIITGSGSDSVIINKNFLTFLTGPYPFTRVVGDAEDEDNYIVLPWNLSTRVGIDSLQNLIRRIPSSATGIEYKVYLSSAGGVRGDSDSVSIASMASLHLSDVMAEDETESLLRRIDESGIKIRGLEQLVTEKDQELKIQRGLVVQRQQEIANKDSIIQGLQSANNGYCSQIAQLKSQIPTVKDVVSWDSRVKNQTTVDCQNFTGKILAAINPATGTFTINII